VGCGLGYYTAVIATVVGPTGRVVGVEVDGALAARARANLSAFDCVEVVEAAGERWTLAGSLPAAAVLERVLTLPRRGPCSLTRSLRSPSRGQ
jgi:protein-L-isoaspartate O-methyltransferase